MPRPLRIEFENAYYHVMNRGAGRKNIFKSNQHREIFIELLAEANQLFGVEIHAYCLMNNHYHLLVKTPYPNLSRSMRHINGLYTQRYNRLEKTDGALFRGRYKAIIISYDEYLLNVSRYIHLNPVTANIVEHAHQFKWSSYNYFINPANKPTWLHTRDILSMIGQAEDYHLFMCLGVDTETTKFYKKEKTPAIYGSLKFKDTLLNPLDCEKIYAAITDYNLTRTLPSTDEIILICSRFFDMAAEDILRGVPGKENLQRKIAIYGCRRWAQATLSQIANKFYCRSHSNVCNVVTEIDNLTKHKNELKLMLDELYEEVFNN